MIFSSKESDISEYRRIYLIYKRKNATWKFFATAQMLKVESRKLIGQRLQKQILTQYSDKPVLSLQNCINQVLSDFILMWLINLWGTNSYYIFTQLCTRKFQGKCQEKVNYFSNDFIELSQGPFLYYFSKRTEWVWSEKGQFLLTFSTIIADLG